MDADQLEGLPDDRLVEQFQQTADRACFGEIFRRHRKAIYQCCLAMMRDREAAADATQETFLKALEGISGYSGGQFRAWLVTIARHQCINLIRARNRGPRSMEDVEEVRGLAAATENVEHQVAVEQMLAGVSATQRLCLKLFYFNGMSYEEIAELTSLKAGAVKSYIQNGRKRLRITQADCEKK